jgi:uncharacterized CHY-type Zn-finger protein
MELAYCGLKCEECPIYLATINNDDELRKDIIDKYYQATNTKVNLESINCLGCKSESGVEFYYCDECKIRECAMSKNKSNCAFCEDFTSCSTLNDFYKQFPSVKTNLEGIRSRIKK